MLKQKYKKLKILYIEDEENIRVNAISYLKRLFDNVYEAKDAFEGLTKIEKYDPHLVISDIKMPKLNGLDMIRKVRQHNKNIQFIVLSAFTDTKYLLDAIDLHLVKYLTKPIKHETIFPLLLQCAKSVFENENNRKYITKDSYFDIMTSELNVKEKIIKLTKNEISFLKLLCENSSRTVTYEQIQNYIWYDEYMSENAIRLLVRDLRKKLPINCIKNLSKIGYKIELF
ncbi:DNA-binding response regulator [Malaciobacter molluscorum LMG 25693]|uniref:DNA-binding response regulator n=1 Tax=Malaciobacter molluscorum LMG 25693 TaxID=870501 RepID=A0A2G1DK04_9BACT|nr:response regulator [Malaciobacter molluscorum]AXX91406.1 two-component system response regulator [Malaciobacter molluscorum LMG 25693]PHO18845.1 DNA-binding response regulator [Malaciobacter molluscorum LMG 25693]